MLIGKARVYDGDSIFFGRVEVRLDAIDAPERDQACLDRHGKFWPCGIVARDALRDMVGDSEVRCAISGKDKYRRLLGICYAGGRDLNAAMVESGYAISYRYFSDRYDKQEDRAKAAQAGIWQDAHFTEPYFCRHFAPGHTCYEFDYASGTGRVAALPLIGKSHAVGAPD
jgi:endonuclease YncB( thermonuclease family)